MARYVSSARAVEELKRRRDELPEGFVASVEDSAGHARGYLSRVLSGKIQQLDSKTLLAVLDHPWVDAREFLERININTTSSPLPYLIQIQRRVRPDPLLKQLERAAATPIDHHQAEQTVLADLNAIEELWFSDDREAMSQLDGYLPTCVSVRSRKVMWKALMAYAEDRRRRSKFSLCARALEGALRLVGTPFEEVKCLQRISYLVSNQGWYELAELFARQGADLSLRNGDHECFGKLLVTQAVMNRSQGNVAVTKSLCLQSLSYLPEDAWAYRVGVYLDLAWCCHESGDLESSEDYLAKAEGIHKTRRGKSWLKLLILSRYGGT